jgi:outer membrane protein assembly factor BamB
MVERVRSSSGICITTIGCIPFQNGGIVFCRLAQTGELLYSGRPGAPGYYYSSPVAADQKVYIASADGVVVVLDAGACQQRVLIAIRVSVVRQGAA